MDRALTGGDGAIEAQQGKQHVATLRGEFRIDIHFAMGKRLQIDAPERIDRRIGRRIDVPFELACVEVEFRRRGHIG